MITVEIKMHFGGTANGFDCQIKENGIPITILLEQVKRLEMALSRKILADAREDVEEHEIPEYLDAQIRTDRLRLELLLQQDAQKS